MLQLAVLLPGGAVLSVATVHAAGGWSAVMATSKDWHLLLPATDPDFPWTAYLGGTLCISIFYCAANQFIVQRTLAAKNEWHARMGVVFTDYLKFLTPLLIVVPGLMAPQLVLGIMWSTVLLSHSEKPIFIYLMNAYGYVTPGIAAMFLLGIFWRRATHAGALAAGAITIPLSVLIEHTAGLRPHAVSVYITPFANRTGIVFWACILTGIAVSLATKPKSKEELKGLIWNRESLRLPADQRALSRGLRSPFLWWAIITAIALFFFVRFP
jgi:Na+/pantothenate symporter